MNKRLVYVKRRGALGDVVNAEPIVTKLLHMDWQVCFVSKYAHIYKSREGLELKNSFSILDKLAIWLKWSFRYKEVSLIDLDNSYENRPLSHIQEAYCHVADLAPAIEIPNHTSFRRTDFGQGFSPTKTVFFHVQSASNSKPYRSIFGIDWKSVEEFFTKQGFDCVELLDERLGYTPIFSKSIAHSRYDLFSLLENAKYFVGKDSGPAHVALSLQLTSFLFFGSVDPLKRIPYKSTEDLDGLVFQNDCEFAGCYHSVKGTDGVACRIVESPSPPCCTFDTHTIIDKISKFINEK